MPLHVDVENSVQREQFDHAAGPLEFGRGPQRESKRCEILGDLTVSRDQLRIEERPGGRVRLENLSRRTAVTVAGRGQVPELQSQELDLPLLLTMGQTKLSLELVPPCEAGLQGNHPPEAAVVVPPPPGLLSIPSPDWISRPKTLSWDRGPSPDGKAAEQIGRWLERVIELQQTGAESPEFFGKTAQALVDLVDLDLGLVLLRHDDSWSVAGSAAVSSKISVRVQQYAFESRSQPAEDLL